MRPSTRMRIATRAALRRRFGYAALRVLRKGFLAAMGAHRRASVGEQVYNGETERAAVEEGYRRGARRLLKRWPALSFDDPRAEP
jgi:hypothetical protein